MSATSVLPSAALPFPARPRTGAAARSTVALRSRYRRQTAALMVATTVVGLWFGLGAPAVSPVTPATPAPVVGATGPTLDTMTGLTSRPTQTDHVGGADRRGRDGQGDDGQRGQHR